MPEKIYMNKEGNAVIKCPSCGKSKFMDMGKYKDTKKAVKGNIKCPCGHAFSFILERRVNYRKATRLMGRFKVVAPVSRKAVGTMMVNDISKSGARIELISDAILQAGDTLTLSFKLDDKHQTQIDIEVKVMTCNKKSVGVKFSSDDISDFNIKAIGFYLF